MLFLLVLPLYGAPSDKRELASDLWAIYDSFSKIASDNQQRLILIAPVYTSVLNGQESIASMYENRRMVNGWGVVVPESYNFTDLEQLYKENILTWAERGSINNYSSGINGKYRINISFPDVSIVTRDMGEYCGYTEFVKNLGIQKSIVSVIDPIGKSDSDYCRDFMLVLSAGNVRLTN
jgi:hypothetical protein